MNFGKQFKEGLITQNPVTVQLLGMCSVLAITTTLFNGIGMGLSVLVILTLSNIFISLLRNIIPNKVRIACYIVVIAGFVTVVDLVLKAFVPALSDSLGLFIPLIVVNCIILGRAEGFSSKNGVLASAVDGICQGLGYTVILVIMCVVREFLGNGTFGTGVSIVSHAETSGLGANATKEAWRAQFIGKSGTLAVTKDGGEIEALTGATITSRAVTSGVNSAIAAVAELG